MKTKVLLVLLLFICIVSIHAQDADTPPDGYLDNCNIQPIMFDFFGPYCLNPVTWNVAGIVEPETVKIGDWLWFREDDDFSVDGGVVAGYTWDKFQDRYFYYVMVEPPHDGIFAAFVRIGVEDVIRTTD